MSAKKQTVGLITFLKGSSDPKAGMPGCANYDHHYGGCLFGGDCLVEQGKRCAHFEKGVLPTAADIGQAEQIYSLYERQCKVGLLHRPQKRICPDCGTGLKPHQKLCDDCRRNHQRNTRRIYQKAFRKKQRVSA